MISGLSFGTALIFFIGKYFIPSFISILVENLKFVICFSLFSKITLRKDDFHSSQVSLCKKEHLHIKKKVYRFRFSEKPGFYNFLNSTYAFYHRNNRGGQ